LWRAWTAFDYDECSAGCHDRKRWRCTGNYTGCNSVALIPLVAEDALSSIERSDNVPLRDAN
jgi:hypothetical protein